MSFVGKVMVMLYVKGLSLSSSVFVEVVCNGMGLVGIVLKECDLIILIGVIVVVELYVIVVLVVCVGDDVYDVIVVLIGDVWIEVGEGDGGVWIYIGC